jgi:hypothetical protein
MLRRLIRVRRRVNPEHRAAALFTGNVPVVNVFASAFADLLAAR